MGSMRVITVQVWIFRKGVIKNWCDTAPDTTGINSAKK